MKNVIQLIKIENMEFHLFLDDSDTPLIEAEGKIYTSPFILFQDFPLQEESQSLGKMAQMVNFLIKGIECHYIENIEEFKKEYVQQIEREQRGVEQESHCLSHYGVYDVSQMHLPLIDGQHFSFFVKDEHTQLPYRVSIHLDHLQGHPEVSYSLMMNKSQEK